MRSAGRESSPEAPPSRSPSRRRAISTSISQPGRFWVDGLEAYAPAAFTYFGQDAIAALPATGTVLVYLDVFEEHVQPAEDPSELVDPALGTIDTTGRTRVGYRVRVAPTNAATCSAAWAALATVSGSTGLLDVARGSTGTPDPCAPPGDPLAQIPDGLLRVEVLDGGTEATARFAWSFEDGSCAVPIVQMPSGNTVQLAPSNLHFGQGDLVEISYLARRADRVDNGALYVVDDVTPGAGGDTLTLHTAVTLPPPTPPATVLDGLCARRWNGEAVGAAAATNALWAGQDLGITFTARPGDYAVGDWWGARLRSESGSGIEQRTAAEPGRHPSLLRAARARRPRRAHRALRLPADVHVARRSRLLGRRVHRLGEARRRPPGGDRLTAAGRRRALPRGRRLRTRHACPSHRAGADRDQRRRPGVDHRRPTERGGDRLRHLRRRRGARRHRPRWHRPGRQRRSRISTAR